MTPFVAVESDGAVFLLPTHEKGGRDRFAKPRARWKERRHLDRALEALDRLEIPAERTTFVDVGAHIGTTAIGAARWFGFRSVVAIEPGPENLRLLRANVAVNDLGESVAVVDAAVADRIGVEELVVRRGFGTKHRLAGPRDAGKETVTVPVTSLDGLSASGAIDPACVGMLWLDVEGHELEVLRGAGTVLEGAPPIVMEFSHRALRKGRMESLESLLAERYTHVLDLRDPLEEPPVPRPLTALPEIAKRHKHGFTDVLVFELEQRRAA
ncbi:MAG TPA: FkbM family methyltransferase [Gaiellaceae bacterium]|nr:FkbM family methyltransferase [Gaiellaceae bacterium]